jgi:hypothetical protein
MTNTECPSYRHRAFASFAPSKRFQTLVSYWLRRKRLSLRTCRSLPFDQAQTRPLRVPLVRLPVSGIRKARKTALWRKTRRVFLHEAERPCFQIMSLTRHRSLSQTAHAALPGSAAPLPTVAVRTRPRNMVPNIVLRRPKLITTDGAER